MIQVQKIKEEHVELIYSWANSIEEWKDKFPPRVFLPESGLGGVIVSNDDIPFVAGFLYFNPHISFIEWFIADPEYREDNRSEGINLVITTLEQIAKDAGSKAVFSVTRSKSLMNKFEELGYSVDTNPSHECIKPLI